MKVMSSNAHAWTRRRQLVIDIVKNYQPDIVGFQEVQQDQLADLIDGLQGYGCHHQGWQAVDDKQELLPIFYLKEHVAISRSGAFWLNETPDIPRIDTGGGEVLRACTWAHVTCSPPAAGPGTGSTTYAIYHTHLDHQKESRRETAARLIMERIRTQSAGRPAILLGDLNTRPGSTTYEIFTSRFRDAFVISPNPRAADDITCHCFTGATKKSKFRSSFQWIDHVLVDEGITCIEAKRVLDALDVGKRLYPSDHFPVVADLV